MGAAFTNFLVRRICTQKHFYQIPIFGSSAVSRVAAQRAASWDTVAMAIPQPWCCLCAGDQWQLWNNLLWVSEDREQASQRNNFPWLKTKSSLYKCCSARTCTGPGIYLLGKKNLKLISMKELENQYAISNPLSNMSSAHPFFFFS